MSRHPGTRGFSALEAVLSITLFLAVLAGASAGLLSNDDTQRDLAQQLGRQARAQEALDRIQADLRQASVLAEDRNGDGYLGPGEDLNGNGLLESAWRVGEEDEQGNPPGEPRSSLRFNRRIDDVDEAGNVVATGIFSSAVRIHREGDTLLRESLQDGVPVQETLAKGIHDLRFTYDAATRIVVVSVDVEAPRPDAPDAVRTLTARVWMRN